jgi:GDPmannose 4,6-dehydratase
VADSTSTAVITGITGQDGSYLAELLLAKGYTVHGIVRRASSFNRSRIEHLRSDPALYNHRLFLHYADLSDATNIRRILFRTQPTELYHLAGQSQPGLSFDIPESTVQETANATLALLEICRDMDRPPRMLHAASSEVFGSPGESPQDEQTPFRPVTPYGCAKAFATDLCRVYREARQMYVCSSLAYNHESPRRSETFVTRKIVDGAVRLAAGGGPPLDLGNLDAQRDWGYAPEYVEAMWRMLQRERADDCVLATGTSTTVRSFATAAFRAAGIDVEFVGRGEDERGRDARDGRELVRVQRRYFRPADPQRLVGDASRAAATLGWRATTSGERVAEAMVRSTGFAVRGAG